MKKLLVVIAALALLAGCASASSSYGPPVTQHDGVPHYSTEPDAGIVPPQ